MAENSPHFVQVPSERLAAEVYEGILEEFIGREGTDYGEAEKSPDAKMQNLKRQVDSGEVVILFDFESSSCTLMRREEADQFADSVLAGRSENE